MEREFEEEEVRKRRSREERKASFISETAMGCVFSCFLNVDFTELCLLSWMKKNRALLAFEREREREEEEPWMLVA